jgi:ketosteroid isomerase-like protein
MGTGKGKCWLVVLVPVILFYSCSRRTGIETEKIKLLTLHREQQVAHLTRNAKQFVGQFADTMISVNRGKIVTVPRDSAMKRFQLYFESVVFKKWEDVHPPVVEFSEDASMAYIVVDKLVVLEYKDGQNKNAEETTHFAWVSVYKKQENGEWQIVCNVSTNEPEKE